MSDTVSLVFEQLPEDGLRHLARQLAPRLKTGDFLSLSGDLGAGKSTFARFLIRALAGREDEEVPSPTFSLVQPYDTPRFSVHHFDFYRISDPREADELGVQDALESGVVLAEWPERLDGELPKDRLDIRFEDCGSVTARQVALTGHGEWSARLQRFRQLRDFLSDTDWREADHTHVNGDASTRSYARLVKGERGVLLMDSPKIPDEPPVRNGKTYSEIVHRALNVRPFIAVDHALRQAGLAAPRIVAQDPDAGFLLIEDFGDLTFTRLAERGEDLLPLYHLAVGALLALRKHPPKDILRAEGTEHVLPPYDRDALEIETELVLDWLLPAATGAKSADETRRAFAKLWRDQFDWLLAQPAGWVLRDFHSPNLILRPDREGLARLGIIDFQDAMRGHAAYDLVSLLQDARLDLPSGLEGELLGYYCDAAAAQEASFDRAAFIRAYRLLGAQRASKILGLFARLARRDGKYGYLKHIPRIARYLRDNLQAPDLAALKIWYDREVPGDLTQLTGATLAERQR
ncbi:MAG: tRNA (adenosine(37)-N6)-threonylcarbamoyltransferase complex ATPase subunit type 1 TsaE [Hyphomicrobiales bacterium]|nr:tRNA (adenosine(37)-N6)-threonylcarbamoyltransferase complex ATPase subunit type 1 TsaE [Hyphomicrobiales bacterium]